MYILLKSTSLNITLVANYVSKYTWRLEFAGVLYQLRFVQPLLLMWLCRFIFGDCLPLSLALHHLLNTINRATTTPIFAQHRISISTEPVHLILHTPTITPLWGGGLDSLLNAIEFCQSMEEAECSVDKYCVWHGGWPSIWVPKWGTVCNWEQQTYCSTPATRSAGWWCPHFIW